MPTPTPFRVRFALVGILALLAVVLTRSEVLSQPGRPGFPGSGIAGRPPGGIGGISGMPGRPGGISGRPGGITGIPGRPGGITGFPGGIAGVPGGVTGFPGGGITGMPGGFGNRTETVWTCSRCGYELGRGPADPGQSSCPRCQAQFTGSTLTPGSGFSRGPTVPSAPFNAGAGFGGGTTTPPETLPPTRTDSGLELPTNPAAGGTPIFPVTTPPPGTGTPGPSVQAPSDSGGSSGETNPTSTSSGKTAKVLKILGIVVASIVLLVVIGMLIAITNDAGRGRPAKRVRRRVVRDDDGYDD